MAQGSTTSPQQMAAANVCGALHRAYRDLRLYPPSHPMARQSVDGFATAADRYLEDWGSLSFEVQENALLVAGDVVYQHETSRDNLAFLLFRDGVRTISLYPGVDPEEIEALVDCLAHADDFVDMEQDIVTALWERDLSHVDYQVVDPFLGGEVLGEGTVDALRDRVLKRLEETTPSALSASGGDAATFGRVRPVAIAGAELQLTPQEVQAGEQALEGLSSVLQDFAEVLLELAASNGGVMTDEALVQSLTGVVSAFLDAGDTGAATFVLGRLEEMEALGSCRPGLSAEVAAGAVTTDHLRRLLEQDTRSPADESQMRGLVRALKGSAVSSLLEILIETEDRTIRKAVLGLLGGEGGVPWRDLERFLRDTRWYVVRNAVQLAAAAGHPQLVDAAPRLLRHHDARVRREVVRALERFSGRPVTAVLTQALSDPDPSVRTLAARGVGRGGGREVEAALLAHIGEREFPSLSAEEVEAFLGAYAEVAQERAVPLLERSWKKRLLSSRPLSFRVAAVLALGRIRAPEAGHALQEAARSPEAQLARAAAQATQSRASLTAGSGS